MPNKQKADQVAALTERFQHAASVAVTDYTGLTVEKATLLRKELRQKNVGYLVAKNTLLKIAAHQAGLKDIDSYLRVDCDSIRDGRSDRWRSPFIRNQHGKSRRSSLKESIFGREIRRVAKLPSREQCTQVTGNLLAPVQNLVFTLNAVTRDFIGTVEALKEKQSKSQ
jgi:large subunit ribosomal protein L10